VAESALYGPDDFGLFFMKEYRLIVAAMMRAGATVEEAEDAVMEAMSLARPRFGGLTSPGAWVRVVALRRFVRHRQRDRERVRLEELVASTLPVAGVSDGALLRLVRTVLNGLPPAQRVVMALHLDGYLCAEIASMVSGTQDTVRSNLRHARRAMAAGLAKGGWNPH